MLAILRTASLLLALGGAWANAVANTAEQNVCLQRGEQGGGGSGGGGGGDDTGDRFW